MIETDKTEAEVNTYVDRILGAQIIEEIATLTPEQARTTLTVLKPLMGSGFGIDRLVEVIQERHKPYADMPRIELDRLPDGTPIVLGHSPGTGDIECITCRVHEVVVNVALGNCEGALAIYGVDSLTDMDINHARLLRDVLSVALERTYAAYLRYREQHPLEQAA